MGSCDHLKDLMFAARELSMKRDLNGVMETVKTVARKLTGSDGATFVLRDGDFCFYADEDAIGPLWKGKRFPLNRCVSGWTMVNRKHAVIEDIFSDPRVPTDAYRSTFVKSLLMVPIRSESPIGAIGNYWATPHEASDEEIRAIHALADFASIALENIDLYQNLEKRVRELEAANRAKDEFLMLISHELRTPLNAMLGWAQIMRANPADANEVATAAETIERNALHQNRLINDLIDNSKVIMGRIKLDRRPVNLREIVEEAVLSRKGAALDRFLHLTLTCKANECMTEGDPERLRQIVDHLISNAIKFTPHGGHIRVSLDKEGPSLVLRVQDDGEGIASGVIANIFDRFSQADQSIVRKHSGLGLGLAIVKHLSEAHGGSVKAESEGPGSGARFTVILPALVETRDSKPVTETESANLGRGVLRGLKLLVIDDEPDVRSLLSVILKKYGAEVKTADGVPAARDILKTYRPDLLLSDISMPGEDGYSLVRKLREGKVADRKDLPAVAVTAFADKEHRQMALNAGFDDFIPKPVETELLVKTVNRVHGANARVI